jgi:hypothetical protein
VDTYLRGWEPTRYAREGRQISCNNARCKAVTKYNVIAREYQDCRRNEDSTNIGKSGAGAENCKTGSVGAPTGEGGVDGHGDQCNEIEHRENMLGGGRDIKTAIHYACGRNHDREEHQGSREMTVDRRYVRITGTCSER